MGQSGGPIRMKFVQSVRWSRGVSLSILAALLSLGVVDTVAYGDPTNNPLDPAAGGNGGGACSLDDIDKCATDNELESTLPTKADVESLPFGCNPVVAETALDDGTFGKAGTALSGSFSPKQIPCKLIFGKGINEFAEDVSSTMVKALVAETLGGYQGKVITFSQQAPREIKNGGSVCMMSNYEGLPDTFANITSEANKTKLVRHEFGFFGMDPRDEDIYMSNKWSYKLLHGKDSRHQDYAGKGSWKDGSGCGKFCTFSVSSLDAGDKFRIALKGKDSDSCRLENNWIRGNWFYSKFYYKQKMIGHDGKAIKTAAEQVGKNSGSMIGFKLTDYGGLKPCGQNALDIMKLTDKIRDTVLLLRDKFPAASSEDLHPAPTGPSSMDRLHWGYQLALDSCNYVSECRDPADYKKVNEENKDRPLCRERKDLAAVVDGGQFEQFGGAGTCQLALAQSTLRELWRLFYYCEVTTAAQRDFFERDPAKMFKTAFGDPDDSSVGFVSYSDCDFGPFGDGMCKRPGPPSYAHQISEQMQQKCDDDDANCTTRVFNDMYRDKMFEVYAGLYGRYTDGGPVLQMSHKIPLVSEDQIWKGQLVKYLSNGSSSLVDLLGSPLSFADKVLFGSETGWNAAKQDEAEGWFGPNAFPHVANHQTGTLYFRAKDGHGLAPNYPISSMVQQYNEKLNFDKRQRGLASEPGGPIGPRSPSELPRKTNAKPAKSSKNGERGDLHSSLGLVNLVLIAGMMSSRRRRRSVEKRGGTALKAIAALLAVYSISVGCGDPDMPDFCTIHNDMEKYACEFHCPCGNEKHKVDLTKEDDPTCPMLSMTNPVNAITASNLADQALNMVEDAKKQLPESGMTFATTGTSNTDTSQSKRAGSDGNAPSGGEGNGGSSSSPFSQNSATAGYADRSPAGAPNTTKRFAAGNGSKDTSPNSAGMGGGAATSGFGMNGFGTGGAAANGGTNSVETAEAKAAAEAAKRQGTIGGRAMFETSSGGAGGSGGGRSGGSSDIVEVNGAGGVTDKNEAYLQQAGQTSLFEVVSKRYSTWNTGVKSKKQFRK